VVDSIDAREDRVRSRASTIVEKAVPLRRLASTMHRRAFVRADRARSREVGSMTWSRMLLALGVVAAVGARAAPAFADEHGDRDEHEHDHDRARGGGGERDQDRDRVERRRDEHGDHDRWEGRRAYDEHHHHGGWNDRSPGARFGWGGGPSIRLPLPAPLTPAPQYGTPYNRWRAPYVPPNGYDDDDRGYRGYDPREEPYERTEGYRW
jgi:hypothetical protein